MVDLTGDGIAWHRAPETEDAAVTVRGPLVDPLLVIYRRTPVGCAGVGDRALLDFWWSG